MSELLAIGMSFASQISDGHQDYKQRTIDKWQQTFNMPRKQKKAVRKHLMLDFQIIAWMEEDSFIFSPLFK